MLAIDHFHDIHNIVDNKRIYGNIFLLCKDMFENMKRKEKTNPKDTEAYQCCLNISSVCRLLW